MIKWILEYYDMDDYEAFDDYIQALDGEFRSPIPQTVYDQLDEIWNETQAITEQEIIDSFIDQEEKDFIQSFFERYQ